MRDDLLGAIHDLGDGLMTARTLDGWSVKDRRFADATAINRVEFWWRGHCWQISEGRADDT